MNPPPPASIYSIQPYGGRPAPTPTPQPYPPPTHAGHMRPPPLDTSFMYNGSHMQQYSNNNSSVYPTPALTSRPQSMYQTPPSSDSSNTSNPKDHRSRRISVTAGDNGWKVSGRSSSASSQYRPSGYEHPGNTFNDRRMRCQSMGSVIPEHPITPAYTPRESHYSYFSPTHATMSPQEHFAPQQPTNNRESFVGGFVVPPPYRPTQETQYQYPQTPHHQPAPQSQYPQTPQYSQSSHHQLVSQSQYPMNTHRQSMQPAQYPQTPNHQPAQQHRSSYYAHNDSYYNNNYAVTTAAASDVSPPSATAEYFSPTSADNPPSGRARSVKSVRSVKSNKSLNGATGEPKQAPPKKRQITVRSVSEHLVWIDIAPNETGAGIAEKIQTIATYKTKKALSITTASGRKIVLNRRPLFDDWANVHDIKHGEEWIVEWGDLDRGMMDRIFSKVVQVGEGRPTNADESQQ